MAVNTVHGEHHGLMTPQAPGPTYPFMKGGIIIGAIMGFMSGLAAANTFTRALLILIVWSTVSAVIGAVGLGIPGWLIDIIRHRSGKEMS
jgi:hypothetical protein